MAALDGRTIAVPFTIPGERVRIELSGPAPELVEILAPSPLRTAPACPHFGLQAEGGRTCGGCTWQHIDYPAQLRFKSDLVTRLVRAAVPGAPAARPTLAATPAGDPWHYRSKVHFAVATPRRGAPVMGHYARRSRTVVPVRECPVHDASGNAVAFALKEAADAAGVRSVASIAVRVARTTGETLGAYVVTHEEDTRIRDACRRAAAAARAPTSLHVNVHPGGTPYIFGRRTRHVSGPARLREQIGGISFLLSPTAFFQTNVAAAQVLVDLVLDAVPPEAAVLDLYAGAGLFALPLARRGHRVVAVEENRQAVADGEASRHFSRVPEARCRFIARPVEAALHALARAAPAGMRCVVLDPPRAGCSTAVVDGVFGRLAPPRAVYVSCDPDALARDVARIVRHGYTIAQLQPVDMFPHTPHVETVAVLDRIRRAEGGTR